MPLAAQGRRKYRDCLAAMRDVRLMEQSLPVFFPIAWCLATCALGADGKDDDGDGIPNGWETSHGTNPLRADTDGDGVADGAEIAQDSDSADATDEGRPDSRTPVSFYFDDHSTSCSEKYRLTVSPAPVGDDALLVNSSGKSEIRMAKTSQQLISLGLMPSKNDDGVNEMAWVDVPETPGRDLSDSAAFSADNNFARSYQMSTNYIQMLHDHGGVAETNALNSAILAYYEMPGIEIDVAFKVFAGMSAAGYGIGNVATNYANQVPAPYRNIILEFVK